jgi:hypothetical protein
LVFPEAKDRPEVITALATRAEWLLTLDEADFQGKLGRVVYGLRIATPGEFLLEQRARGVLWDPSIVAAGVGDPIRVRLVRINVWLGGNALKPGFSGGLKSGCRHPISGLIYVQDLESRNNRIVFGRSSVQVDPPAML